MKHKNEQNRSENKYIQTISNWKDRALTVGFARCTLFISSISIYHSAHNQLSERFSGNQLYKYQNLNWFNVMYVPGSTFLYCFQPLQKDFIEYIGNHENKIKQKIERNFSFSDIYFFKYGGKYQFPEKK